MRAPEGAQPALLHDRTFSWVRTNSAKLAYSRDLAGLRERGAVFATFVSALFGSQAGALPSSPRRGLSRYQPGADPSAVKCCAALSWQRPRRPKEATSSLTLRPIAILLRRQAASRIRMLAAAANVLHCTSGPARSHDTRQTREVSQQSTYIVNMNEQLADRTLCSRAVTHGTITRIAHTRV